MRGLAIVFAALLLTLAVAPPARAQETGLPLWLVGTWCGELGGAEAPGKAGPLLCDTWIVGPNGTLENHIRPPEGSDVVDDGSSGTISLENGKLVMRGGADGRIIVDYREVSRGPYEFVLANQLEGFVEKLVLRREGDDLVEEIWLKGRTEPQRSVYHRKK